LIKGNGFIYDNKTGVKLIKTLIPLVYIQTELLFKYNCDIINLDMSCIITKKNINCMGVVIAKLCPCSNGELERVEHVVKITLDITLKDVTYPRVDDEYTLFLFASSDVQRSSLLNTTVSLTPSANKRPKQVKFCVTVEPHLPYKLHTWLFATCKNLEGLKSQTLLATGDIKFSELLYNTKPIKIILKDIKQNNQASIYIQCTDPRKLKSFNQTLSIVDVGNVVVGGGREGFDRDSLCLGNTPALTEQYLVQIYKGYDELEYTHEQKFAYIDTHCGRLPLLSFPVLATYISPKESEATALLQRLLFYAALNCETNIDYVIRGSLAEKMEIICEMLTLIPRLLLYELDYVRTPGNKTAACDQWTKLNVFPTLGLAAFDCEDGAEFMLELIHVFKYTNLNSTDNPVLFHLQSLLNRYTPFLTIGILNESDDTKTPHAFVILLDRDYVNDVLLKHPNSTTNNNNNYAPTCVLESTNYTQSVWSLSDPSQSEHEIDEYNRISEDMPLKSINKNNKHMIKCKMPVAIIKRDQIYGKVTALLTADHHTPTTETISFHCLIGDDILDDQKVHSDKWKVGASIESLTAHNHKIRIKVVLSLESKSEKCKFEKLLNEFPPSSFPKTVARSLKSHSKQRIIPMYVIRKNDFDSNRNCFLIKDKPYDCTINSDLSAVML